jgi:hypothetical protein
VLAKLSVEDRKLVAETSVCAAAALELIISNGVDAAMQEFN